MWVKKGNTAVNAAPSLNTLSDVSALSPTNGYVLTYNAGIQKWVAQQVSGTGASNSGLTISSIVADLENPFKKTRIKCIGDSITNGDGSTGFVDGGYNGWVKSLNTLITSKYNGEETVGFNSKYITVTSTYIIDGYGNHVMPKIIRINSPGDTGKGVNFSFYGDHFTIYYTGHNAGGIAEVWVDGVKQGELDTYSATLSVALAYNVTGLSAGNHSVQIKETSRKNAAVTSSSALIFEGVKVPKTKTVINGGSNGKDSSWTYTKMNTSNEPFNITANDDIILFQMGTNDRGSLSTTEKTKWYQREVVKYALGLGSKIILMCASPVPSASESGKNFKMHDVNMAVRQVALELDVPFISNYDAFNQYCTNAGVTLTSLLGADQLHPNDTGYTVMANNIFRNLGLTVVTDGVAL